MTCLKTIVRAGAVALSLASVAAATAQAAELRLASYLSPEHFGTKLIIDPFIAKVDEYTGGEVKITNYPGGQLANAPGTLNAVKTGIANMGLVGVGYVGDSMPLSTIAELPGAFSDLQAGHAAYWKVVQDMLVEAEFLPNRVRPVMMSLLPQTQLVLAENRVVGGLADLAGLKIRVPHATAGDAISALGMVPVEMPVSDLYLALERGTVDGAVTLTASIPSYKLNEVTEAVTTNLALGSIGFFVVVAENDWRKLTPEQQEAVARAGDEVGAASAATFVKVNGGAEAKLAEAGMTMVEAPAPMLAEVDAALASVGDRWVETVSARNPMAADVSAAFADAIAAQ